VSQSVERPDLGQLRIQAKELLRNVRAGDQAALARVVPYFGSSPDFKLSNAQLVIARENGFESWAGLRKAIAIETDPLFDALERRNEEEAIGLIKARPSLVGTWQKGRWGWVSPLHRAAQLGMLQVAKALVEAGAEIYAVNQGSYPPAFDAIPEHMQVLMEASAASDNGQQPPTYGCGIDIVLAARAGLLDRVQMHVAKDPLAVYRRGCIGESVLHWPAHNGYVEIVAYLLDHGALIEADEIGLYGGKPLHWASEHAPKCVRLLLDRGANPMSRNLMPNEFEGFTPLHMMARQREEVIDCASQLVAAGADPTALDAKGRTPLDIAVEGGRQHSADYLRSLTH